MRSKRKKASRCAKTGCGSQRLLRCRSHPAGRCPNSSSLFPPLAAVVAVALFSRFSNLLLRSRLYALAERKVLRKRNTIGGAVNRRSPKNAFSEAASIFGLRQPLRGLKGASSPFLVGPARRNRWCFSGSLLARKRELSPNAKALYPRATSAQACLTARHTLHTPPSSQSPAGYRNAPARGCTGRRASSLRRRGHSPSRR